MARLPAAAGRSRLALALGVAAAGCSFGGDPGGARFACDSLTPCPDGIACIDGYCQSSEPADAAAGPGADGRPGAALEWREAAVGTHDNAADLAVVATPATLSGIAGDLYVAIISTKPPREIQEVDGLGLEWQEVRQQCSGRSTASLAMFWGLGAGAGGGAVSAIMAGDPQAGSAVIAVHRYSGADPEAPIGEVSSANTNGTDGDAACQGGADTAIYALSSLDIGAPGSIVLSGAHTANYAHEPGDAYTERSDDQSGASSTSSGVAVQDRRLAAPESDLQVTGGFGDKSPDWAVIAVELRE
jgi:hypothetical protein